MPKKVLKGLKNFNDLLSISEIEFYNINKNIDNNAKDIQLLDYAKKIDISEERILKLEKEENNQIPELRRNYFDKYIKTVQSLKTMEQNLSLLRLNPYTEFEKRPYLFFGMGGGSKALCKGLPFDVLSMILTGEKIRRNLGIKKCRILLANEITYTNISRNKEFSKSSIDNVMKAEKEIILLVLKKFNILKYWDVFLQSEINFVIGNDLKKEYEQFIKKADFSNIVGGHHYSIEMADIYSLVGKKSGGIKLGWFMRNIDTKNGGYIMDEQPFHARYVMFLAEQGIRNRVSFAYVNAGAKLYPGPTGHLEKESPYICYDPKNRLLLSPFENPILKLKNATLAGGAFQFKYYRKMMNGIIELFEEIVLGQTDDGLIRRIEVLNTYQFRGSGIAEKIDYILRYIFEGEERYKEIWKNAFGGKNNG